MTITVPEPFDLEGSSFSALLRRQVPEVYHGVFSTERRHVVVAPVEGTTVLALTFGGDGEAGVVMAGDRRATEGFSIAHRAMEKVFPADGYSAIGIAGALMLMAIAFFFFAKDDPR